MKNETNTPHIYHTAHMPIHRIVNPQILHIHHTHSTHSTQQLTLTIYIATKGTPHTCTLTTDIPTHTNIHHMHISNKHHVYTTYTKQI